MKKIKKVSADKVVRYGVVGLGDIAQTAVLPGFKNAGNNSVLAALFSDDPVKLKKLARLYRVPHAVDYKNYEAFLHTGEIDAVYICLPNSLHTEFAVRAAHAGVHVLSEKPLAKNEDECQQIIHACAENRVKLMTAYRLHFEHANLEAVHLLHSGKIGDIRIFQALFTQQVKPGDIRLDPGLGGGSLYDIGVYCINASRYLFRDEPTEVFAYSARNGDPRFKKIDEMTSAVLRFPKDRLASFTTSFGASPAAVYTVVGTKGIFKLTHAFQYTKPIEMELTIGDRTQKRTYGKRDQFGPEILYFSDCILNDHQPEASGIEALIDVHIVRSLYQSAASGLPVRIKALHNEKRPDLRQEIYRSPARRPPKIHAASPTR